MKSSRDNTRQVKKLKATFSRFPFGGGREVGMRGKQRWGSTLKREFNVLDIKGGDSRRISTQKLDYNPSQ